MNQDKSFQFRMQEMLRDLILSGFQPDQRTREQALSLYEEIIGGERMVRMDLRDYGHPSRFILVSKHNEMAELCKNGKKIHAVKMMREQTGLSLQDAKVLVDQMYPQPLQP